jgi:acetyl esterase/lipase
MFWEESSVFDLAGKGDSFTSKAAKDPFKLVDPLGIAKIYLGANNPTSPLISPLYGELSGLPPVLIHAAQYDVFLSDSTRFAETAENAGVSVDIKVWRKMWHIFHMQGAFCTGIKKGVGRDLLNLSGYLRHDPQFSRWVGLIPRPPCLLVECKLLVPT